MTDAIQKAREALEAVKQLTVGDRCPNWNTIAAVTQSRFAIANICDAALAALDAETPATPADVGELVERLRQAADTSASGGGEWYQLVHRCREAAAALERVVRDRDEAREANRKLHRRLQPFEGMFLNFKLAFDSWANCLFRTQWEHPREANRSQADFLAWTREIDKEYANRRAESAEAKLAEARKVIEAVNTAAAKEPYAGQKDDRHLHNAWRGWWKKVFGPALEDARRFLEETK